MKTIRTLIIIFVCLLVNLNYSLAQSNDGDSLFETPKIHDIYITFTQNNFWDTLVSNYELDTMMLGTITIDNEAMDSIGVQLKGNSSYNTYPGFKKSMKIAFDEYKKQKYDGLKRINLHNSFKDPTLLREKIMLDFCKRHAIPAPRCTYARVYINNRYWGLYTIVEQVNKTFLSDRFGDNDGNLFKGDPQGSLQWMGANPSLYYSKYELKTNETANNWTDLVNLINKINNTQSAVFYDSLEKVLDSETFIKVWASNNMFANMDSYQGSGHNYYLYNDTTENRFKFITWDVNEAFGNFQMNLGYPGIETMSILYIPSPANSRPLMNKMLQNTVYKANYVNTLCDFINTDFSNSFLDPIIDSLANVIRADVYADTNKMYTNAQFETNLTSNVSAPGTLPGLKSFINNRRTSMINELSTYSCLSAIENRGQLNIDVYPIPSSGLIYFDAENISARNRNLEIYNSMGQLILKEDFHNSKLEVNLQNKTGLYFYMVIEDNQIVTSGKLVMGK